MLALRVHFWVHLHREGAQQAPTRPDCFYEQIKIGIADRLRGGDFDEAGAAGMALHRKTQIGEKGLALHPHLVKHLLARNLYLQANQFRWIADHEGNFRFEVLVECGAHLQRSNS